MFLFVPVLDACENVQINLDVMKDVGENDFQRFSYAQTCLYPDRVKRSVFKMILNMLNLHRNITHYVEFKIENCAIE